MKGSGVGELLGLQPRGNLKKPAFTCYSNSPIMDIFVAEETMHLSQTPSPWGGLLVLLVNVYSIRSPRC